MRKKTAAIVTGFMITLGMLGGCGSAGDSTGNANASGENHLNFGCSVYSVSLILPHTEVFRGDGYKNHYVLITLYN